MKVYTVFDSAVGAYLPPFFSPAKGAAIRSFRDAANSSGHEFHKHAPDFTLFELGEFDELTAKFSLHEAPIPLGTAHEFVERPDSARSGQAA